MDRGEEDYFIGGYLLNFVGAELVIVVGAFLGMAYAIVAEMIDQRLRKVEDIEAWLGVRSLGAIRRSAAEPRGRLLTTRIGRFLPRPQGSY